MNIRSPDPDAADLELLLADAGDRDAAERLLCRVSLAEFDSLAVRVFLIRFAGDVLNALEHGKASDFNFAKALRLTGKRKISESVDLYRVVLAYMDEGITQNRAIYLAAQDTGADEAKIKAAVHRYRDNARHRCHAEVYRST